jgi:hypothetical protein
MASIRADMQLNAAPFIDGIARVQTQMRNLQAAAAGVTAAFFAIRSTMAGLRGVFEGMKGALDLGGKFSDMAAATGASVSELVLLTQAFQNNGIAADAVAPMIARFQRALGGVNEEGQSTAGALEKLGVNTLALSRMSVAQQFQELSRAFSSIEDPAERTRRAMELFGRSGAQMITLFRDPQAFTRAAAEIGSMGEVLEANAARFDSMSDALTTAGQKMDQFFVGVMSSFDSGGALERAAQADFTAAGQSAGAVASALGSWLGPLQELNTFMTTKVPVFSQIRQAVEGVISPRISATAADTINRQTESQVGTFDARVRSVSSEDERTQLMEDLGAAIEAARDRLDNLDNEFADLRPMDRIDPQNAISGQITLLEQQRMILATITPEILAANAAEAERAAALRASAAAAAKLAAQLDKSLEARDTEQEKRILADLAPEDAERRVLDQVGDADKSARLVLDVTGLPDVQAAKAALDAVNARSDAEIQLRTVGLPNAAEMIKMLDTASGKVVELALEATGLENADQIRAALDQGDRKTITMALEATGLASVGELRAALDGVPDKTITMALEATGAASIEELRARLDAAPDEKTVEMILRATGTENIDAAKAKLADVQSSKTVELALQATGAASAVELEQAIAAADSKTISLALQATGLENVEQLKAALASVGDTDISITAEGVTAEIERLRTMGAEATDAERARLVELIEAEKALLAIKQRSVAEDEKRAAQAARLANMMTDLSFEADKIMAEAAGDTTRAKEIEVEQAATTTARRFESEGMDPADAAALARAKAEADALRAEAGNIASRGPVSGDAQRSIGLGGSAGLGPSVDVQKEIARKQEAANRHLSELVNLMRGRQPVMLAEVFD